MGCLPHLASDGLDLTVYSIHRVIMTCSLVQEFFTLSCDPSGTGSLRRSPVYDSSVHFSVEVEVASIEDQSWFLFLSGNELHEI